MNLERISSRPVIRAPRSSTLRDAADLMRRHHVGALVVTDDAPNDHRVAGIVTDRDLVLKAVAQGISPTEATLDDVMSEGLATVKGQADVRTAMEVMRAHGVRRLAVTDEAGAVTGFVSFDDVVAALAAEMTTLARIVEAEQEHEANREADARLVTR